MTSTAPSDVKELWDARDVARYFRASRSWVYHRAEAGLLPCVRIGGLLRFHPDAIRAVTVDAGLAKGKILSFKTKDSR